MKELIDIKKNNKWLEVVFDFLDRVSIKMIKVSSEFKSANTVVFIDYIDDAKYYVDIDTANRIIDYCYSEYFFKVILSGSNYYNKIKEISLELEIEPSVFDLFFRSFFLAIKQRYTAGPYKNAKEVFYKTVYNAPYDAFENITIIKQDYFIKKAEILLNRIEELRLLNFKEINVTNDDRFVVYFAISCNTFKFNLIEPLIGIKKGYESFSRMFEFLDLKIYLNVHEGLSANLLIKLDRIIHMIVLISFKDEANFRFLNNNYGDNSYIKKLNLERITRKQKNNA